MDRSRSEIRPQTSAGPSNGTRRPEGSAIKPGAVVHGGGTTVLHTDDTLSSASRGGETGRKQRSPEVHHLSNGDSAVKKKTGVRGRDTDEQNVLEIYRI